MSDRTFALPPWLGPGLATLATLALVLVLAATSPTAGLTVEGSVGVGVAFVGGLLALLSPCSGAILPAFFAYGFDTRRSLLAATYAFYLGLATVFVPLGFAASLLARWTQALGDTTYVVTGVVLMALAVLTLADSLNGRLQRFAWVQRALSAPARATSGNARAYLVGATFALATTSCTAPILGGIVALASGTGPQGIHAVALFLAFALGIAAPLFLLAASFDRWGRGMLRRTRASALRTPWGPLPLTRALTAGSLALFGAILLLTRGTLSLAGAYARIGADRLAYEWSLGAMGRPAVAALVLAGAVLAVAALAWRSDRQDR